MSVTAFTGKLDFCSNFYPSPISYDGLTWPTVEHAFQAAKTVERYEPWWSCVDLEGYARIWNADTPGKAKRLGREVRTRDDWDAMRVKIMTRLINLKFADSSALAQRLLNTGDRKLEEVNWWGDRFWGIFEGKGENHLGRILMDRRAQLRQGTLL